MPVLAFLLGHWQYVLIGVLVLALGVQSKRLDWCQEGRAEDQVQAQQRETSLRNTLETQEKAVQTLKADGEARVKRAQDGLKIAQEGTKAARSEAERLMTLAKAPAAPTACPAADAVKEIRRGL